MEHLQWAKDHPKRRRRRLQRSPISGRLLVDDHGTGDVGMISEDLFSDLFGRHYRQNSGHENGDTYYVAVAQWRPLSTTQLEDSRWSILPVIAQTEDTDLAASSLRFPASSPALQGFLADIHSTENTLNSRSALEILVLDVQPLPLDTIFVKVNGDALQKHEEVQKRFGGGFHTPQTNGHVRKGKESSAGSRDAAAGGREEILRFAIRRSFAAPTVVHRGDRIPLPLPAHPITHVPFPPVKITMCEPVDQGVITGQTKIVLDVTSHGQQAGYQPAIRARGKGLKNLVAEEDDETSAEQFFSAAETDERRGLHQENGLTDMITQSSTSGSSDSGDDSLSDESDDNIISLSAPALPLQLSGTMSSFASATPRALVYRPNGISTPGSVYSNYTAATARQGAKTFGKPFRVSPLFTKIPDIVLHPPPSDEEDDEARVFVDVKALVRLGCFSGDWVKVSIAPAANDTKESLAYAFRDEEPEAENFRVLKIYGLSDSPAELGTGYHMKDKSKPPMPRAPRLSPKAYISPVLFANLGHPKQVSICAMSPSQTGKRFVKSKTGSSSIPPIAREITLLRLPTPLSTERIIQAGLLVGLKQYFERRRRILQKGDLVGIAIDVEVSRFLPDTASADDPDHGSEEIYTSCTEGSNSRKESIGVAWFKVGQIQVPPPEEDEGQVLDTWGRSASIEPMTTRMIQAGSEHNSVPPAMDNPWEFYFGVRNPPRSINPHPSILHSVEILHPRYVPTLRRRIRELLAAAMSPQALHLDMKPIVLLLHSTQRNIGKASLISGACADLGIHVFPIDAYEILSEGGAGGGGDVKTEATLRAKVERALTCGAEYTLPVLRHAEALTADRIASALKDMLKDLRALAMTTTELEKVPESVRSLVTHELEVSAPDEGERQGILQGIIGERRMRLAHDIDLSAVAVKTAALVAGDLIDVVDRALVARQDRLEKLSTRTKGSSQSSEGCLIRDILVSGGATAQCVTKADFDLAVEAARKNFADSIGAPKIPNVSWDDVGGLTNVKDAVMETIQLPLERPELFAKGMKKRSGILFYGPPGTGKTLLAKAIATEFSLNFFSVKGPELLNMYIGESEANVRRVFQRARDARPCVVFFDELDSVAPKRGNQGDSGGVMDRIVSQLLAELDGMSDGDGGGGGVFVIGATNRPDLLDQALLRPGRFDKMLYLGVSDTHDKQLTILEALIRNFTLHPELSLRRVAETLPFTYTGADLYALCSDAMLKAITRQASAVDAKIKALPGGPVTTAYFFDHLATQDDIAVMVTEEDFRAAQQELVGSVR